MLDSIQNSVDTLIKGIPGDRKKVWTWRLAANHFVLKSAMFARKFEEDLSEDVQHSMLSHIYASERCINEIEKIRQERDSHLRL